MKTRKIIQVEFTKPERTEKEVEVADRDYYIEKYIKHLKKDKKTIVIEIYGGCLNDVHNLPDDYNYTLVDYDNLSEMDEEEFIEEVVDFVEDDEE
jgi:hypothetical protein